MSDILIGQFFLQQQKGNCGQEESEKYVFTVIVRLSKGNKKLQNA